MALTLQQCVHGWAFFRPPCSRWPCLSRCPRPIANAQGKGVAFSQAGRATLAMMALDGHLVDDRGGGHRGHRAAADRRVSAGGHHATGAHHGQLRRRRDLSVPGRLRARAGDPALGAGPAHRLCHAEAGRHPAQGDRRRDDGRHCVREHVGVQHRHRRDDGADRAVGDRRGAAPAYRPGPGRARRHSARGPRPVQLRLLGAAGRGLRRLDRRAGHHHRLAAQRHPGALCRAERRHPHRFSGMDGDRRADDAGLPAAGLVPEHERAVSLAHGRDRGRARVRTRRMGEARRT